AAGRPFDAKLLEELDALANRGYTEGFYRRHAPSELQNYADGASRNRRRIFVGEILGPDQATGLVCVAVKNRFAEGDDLELLTPQGQHRFRVADMLGPDGKPLHTAPGDGWQVRLPLSWPESRYGLLTAAL
ncbi:MAG: U32 family peptidase C-terminal domain-containing protein, partial [Thiohalocapsa sp.]